MKYPAWPEHWVAVTGTEAKTGLAEQLARESIEGHPLHGLRVEAIGRCLGSDDVLFHSKDGQLVEVHLTWGPKPDPSYPTAEFYDSFEAWAACVVSR